MILENKGLNFDTYFLPPFFLSKGELVVVYLLNGGHFFHVHQFMQLFFSGQHPDENIVIHERMMLVEPFKESIFRRLFNSVTVGEYLKTNANNESSFATRIYENPYITKDTKINSLAGTQRKLLYLYATISKSKNIVFDVVGLDPKGAEEIYSIVKGVVNEGGSAILLDNFDEFKSNCTKFVELEFKK